MKNSVNQGSKANDHMIKLLLIENTPNVLVKLALLTSWIIYGKGQDMANKQYGHVLPG